MPSPGMENASGTNSNALIKEYLPAANGSDQHPALHVPGPVTRSLPPAKSRTHTYRHWGINE